MTCTSKDFCENGHPNLLHSSHAIIRESRSLFDNVAVSRRSPNVRKYAADYPRAKRLVILKSRGLLPIDRSVSRDLASMREFVEAQNSRTVASKNAFSTENGF